MYDCFSYYLFFMRFYRTVIYNYVYVVMFDYVVQVGELLEFLCVDLHNQCDNAINQCCFNFCIVVHNGTGHIIAWFLWAHPNSLDWPIKSSDPNCVCVIYGIYMNYIYIYKGKRQVVVLFYSVFSWSWEEHVLQERTLQSTHTDCFGYWKGKAN